MNHSTEHANRWQTAKTPAVALYELIYINGSLHRSRSLPKHTAGIAYGLHIATERRYLIPQGGRWIEVNEETALQRAEGLRRLRPSNHALTTEHSVV